MNTQALLRDAEAVVAKAKANGADAAEAFVLRSASGGVRVEKNDLGGVETDATYGLGLRVVKERRVGFAYLTSVKGAADGVADAFAAARLSQPLPKFSFPGPFRPKKIPGLHDRRIESLEGPDAIDMAWDLVRAVADVNKRLTLTEAGVSYGASAIAIANTEGLAVAEQETILHASCFVVQSQEGVSTGFASRDSARLDLTMTDIGEEAARLALAAKKPTKLPKAGTIPLVVRPESAADLFDTITVPSLFGKQAHRDESYYSGKLGKQVAHPKFSLVDDPTSPKGLGASPFDDEGQASRRVAPIANGVLKTFLFDRAAAAEYGGKPTSSGLRVGGLDGRSYKSPPTASGRNLTIKAPSTTTKRLIADIDDGLMVHDMLGVHTANTVSGDFSVTSSVLFRIHKGAIEGPVAPLGIAGNLHETLRKGVTLGDDVKAMAGEAAWTLPSVRFDHFTVTP